MTVLFGSFAVGGALWGQVADRVGISNASLIAGILILLGLLLVKRFPLTRARGQDFGPANRPAPTDAPPAPDVALEMVLTYPVERARRDEFTRLMHSDVRRQRLRNGATRWQLTPRETPASSNGTIVYEEAFSFTSWSDRLRFHARTTKADAVAESEALRLVVGTQPPVPIYRPLVHLPPPPPPISARHIPSPPPLINWDWLATRFLEELGTMLNRAMGERPEPRERRRRRK
jgi:hypothetical protein